jgi:hypothetical protein
MRKIKAENIKVGGFIYLTDKFSKNRRFILEILKNRTKLRYDINFWGFKSDFAPVNQSIFDPVRHKQGYTMLEEDWEDFHIFKLNKEETSKFNKLLILKNL